LNIQLKNYWVSYNTVFLKEESMRKIRSPLTKKNKKGWILMIGYAPDASGAKMEEDFLKILKSAK